MIISHRHRFIFLHCRKTAGSSIAELLSRHLGPNDLHLGTWPEAFNQGIEPNRRARQDLRHPIVVASYLTRLARNPTDIFNQAKRIAAFNGAQRLKYRSVLGPSPEHAKAVDLRSFTPEAWSQYFKFCFVRNPFERAVSDYIWRTRKRGRSDLSFVEFLQRIQQRDFSHPVIPHQFDNWPVYTINDRIAVDFVGRFENLEQDVQTALEKIGLPIVQLPQEKKMRSKHDLGQWYGHKERLLVEQLFANELNHFNYQLESG